MRRAVSPPTPLSEIYSPLPHIGLPSPIVAAQPAFLEGLAGVCFGSKADRESKEETKRSHFGGNIAMASTSYRAPGRASWHADCGAGRGRDFVYVLSRTSRYSAM